MPATARRHDLDWLRLAAVFALIPYHASRIFDTWEAFYVKNAETSVGLTGIRAVLDPWGMPLLFAIAGAATWLALRHRTGVQYLKERVVRLIVPLLVGVVVLVPPQAYLAWLGQGNRGSLGQFLGSYWAMRTGEPLGFTGGFTVGHLWFVLYLFVFSLVALPLFLFLRGPSGNRAVRWLASVVERPGVVFLMVIPFRATEPPSRCPGRRWGG